MAALACCPIAAVQAHDRERLVVERTAPVLIEPGNHFSENTRLRIHVLHPRGHNEAGTFDKSFEGSIFIEEWRTAIYDGRSGATRLPMRVTVHNGTAEVVLKSLARYTVYDSRSAPVPQVAVHLGQERVLVEIPQWVDEDGNDKTDWLEQRVEEILRQIRSSGVREVLDVVSALGGWKESYKRDCGGFAESEPRTAAISSVCIDWDGVNAHRLNRNQELTATVLHELRHVWAHYRPARTLYKLRLLNAPSGRRQSPTCGTYRVGLEPCAAHISDERYAAQEKDAEMFANRYKGLFP